MWLLYRLEDSVHKDRGKGRERERERERDQHKSYVTLFTYREVASIVLDSFRSDEASDGEPCGAVGPVTLHDGVTPGHWHVVNHPLMHVALVDTLTKKLQFSHIVLVVHSISLCA